VGLLLASVCHGAPVGAEPTAWRPSAGHTQIPIWPGVAPDQPAVPGPETATPGAVTNVTRPTMTVYAPSGRNTGSAIVVVPGGGFQMLAIDLEGTEVCDWLTSRGVTCILLKYRVPSAPYVWQCDCRPHNLSTSLPSLEDVQRTLRLARLHARAWRLDPHRIGVLGFSAGGFLVAEASTRFGDRLYAPIDAADRQSSRPDFAVALYPGHLWTGSGLALTSSVPVSAKTPPTFIVQAEDDPVDDVRNSLAYFLALKAAEVPVEMHIYADGGHAFGLRRTSRPITRWPGLMETWLHTIGMLPSGPEG
jgi:acetyl esterase/lipase